MDFVVCLFFIKIVNLIPADAPDPLVTWTFFDAPLIFVTWTSAGIMSFLMIRLF